MKAAVLEDKGVMTYKDVPTPEPGVGQVLVKVKAVSICGSDIKRFVDGHREYNLILGHEAAGIIDKVGDGVNSDYMDRPVAVIPLIPCFECEQCERGFYSACHSYSFIGSRQNGCYAEYVVVPVKNVMLVPANLNLEHVALIEPSSVARHMLALGNFKCGETAIVMGAGSIGLMLVQWLRILGAKRIVVSDILDGNLEIASNLGAHYMLNPTKVDLVKELKALTGNGADLTLEATGVPSVLEQTISVTRPRGSIVLAGNQPLDKNMPLTFFENMMRSEIRIMGCFMSYSAPFPGNEWSDTIESLVSGDLDMETMISHRYSLSKAPEVFKLIGSHQLAHQKIMLNPEEIV